MGTRVRTRPVTHMLIRIRILMIMGTDSDSVGAVTTITGMGTCVSTGTAMRSMGTIAKSSVRGPN